MDKITSRILAVTIPLCVIAWFMMLAWMSTPAEWEIKINLTADDNVLEIVETVDKIQNRTITCYPPNIKGNYTIIILRDGSCIWEELNDSTR